MDSSVTPAIAQTADPRARNQLLAVAASGGLAALYPWALTGSAALAGALGLAHPAAVAATALLGMLAGGSGVVAFVAICRRSPDPWTRGLCHLAATTPTLFVGLMN